MFRISIRVCDFSFSMSSSSTCGRTHGADVTNGWNGGVQAQYAWVRAHARGQSMEGDRRQSGEGVCQSRTRPGRCLTFSKRYVKRGCCGAPGGMK